MLYFTIPHPKATQYFLYSYIQTVVFFKKGLNFISAVGSHGGWPEGVFTCQLTRDGLPRKEEEECQTTWGVRVKITEKKTHEEEEL